MAVIFENRKIERNDLGPDKLKFPGDAILTNLPLNCRNLRRGEEAKGLEVKDDQGGTHPLTIKKDKDGICFTGWKEFTKRKDIKDGDGISVYTEDDYFGSGPQYIRIKVQKA